MACEDALREFIRHLGFEQVEKRASLFPFLDVQEEVLQLADPILCSNSIGGDRRSCSEQNGQDKPRLPVSACTIVSEPFHRRDPYPIGKRATKSSRRRISDSRSDHLQRLAFAKYVLCYADAPISQVGEWRHPDYFM